MSGTLKLDLAQFRALEAFAMFASDLDAASRQQLDQALAARQLGARRGVQVGGEHRERLERTELG